MLRLTVLCPGTENDNLLQPDPFLHPPLMYPSLTSSPGEEDVGQPPSPPSLEGLEGVDKLPRPLRRVALVATWLIHPPHLEQELKQQVIFSTLIENKKVHQKIK